VSSFRLGLLVIICGTVLLVTIIWLGASRFFEDNLVYVTYFDESVKGLQQDAIVNYRGVGVGRAVEIGLAPDGRLIKVVMHLHPEFRVDQSLAIQLREMGLTGLRYLEIDTAPADVLELTPRINFTSEHPVIPSYPSEIVQLKTALDTIYKKINQIDLQSLARNWTRTAELINDVLVHLKDAIDPEEWQGTVLAISKAANETARFAENINKATSQKMKEGFDDLAGTLDATRQAAESLAKQLNALPPDAIRDITGNLNRTISEGGRLVTHVDQQVAQSNAMLQQTILQLKQLLAQMSALARGLKDQPNRIIFPPRVDDPFERK
jgi:phospholipid/cholesterol/gamma-HCH transport system substrate-binding protein